MEQTTPSSTAEAIGGTNPEGSDAHSEHAIGESSLSSGELALALVQRQIRRLGSLQGDVVTDRDPESLHQLRVSLRRLRTALGQFGPALELPESVNERRIAAVARRTGLCRDLDVLGIRLREQLLPRLPEGEQQSLDKAMKRLSEDRAQAFDTLLEALRSPRYLKLLERLHKWQKKPHFTSLGRLPLIPWLVDWQAPFTAGLFLHPGWLEENPAAENLHDLRKRIKQARYAMESLERWCTPPLLTWIENLRQAQDHLGELHDLQVLNRSLVGGEHLRKASQLPMLRAELESQQQLHWLRWRGLAQTLHQDSHRKSVQRHLQDLGQGELST